MLTRLERETTINFNDAEDTASIYTASPTVARRLERRLGRKPDVLGRCSWEWVVPKKWCLLPRLRAKPANPRGQIANLQRGRPPASLTRP